MANIKDIITKTTYVSVSASRHENNICTYKDHLLYSRSNVLVLINTTNGPSVPDLIAGHKADINGQRFIPTIGIDDNSNIKDFSCNIISTSYDKSAIIWRVSKKTTQKSIVPEMLFNFKSPTDSEFITRFSLRCKSDDKFITITTTLDNLVHLWHNDQLIETVKTTFCCVETKLHYLHQEDDENQTFILAFLAGSDNIIHIYQILENKLRHILDLSGHSDWTKCIEIFNLPNRKNEILVASASQDSYIRVWHMKLVSNETNSNRIRTSIGKYLLVGNSETSKYNLVATLETVLSGHEGIVTSLSWFKRQESTLQLISCSADKTIVIWQAQLAQKHSNQSSLNDETNSVSVGVWKELERFGETGETNLPFLSICLSDNERTFYAHSLRGAIHSWKADHEGKWISDEPITGHFEPVTDLCWEEDGSYLLSVSLDKTCRVHTRINDDSFDRESYPKWIELARPQVHGHEINCIASLGFTSFATGAEEKTIRVFEATQFFVDNYTSLAKKNDRSQEKLSFITKNDFPKHAQLPALGLSIKASQAPFDIESIEGAKKGDANNSFIAPTKLIEELSSIECLNRRPNEEILLQSTLWWEKNKLFGHGNELHALAYGPKEFFLASASKANRSELANILIWDSKKFRKVGSIEHHTLTITRLKFSPCSNEYLLSVSRDRTWCLSKRNKSSIRSSYLKVIGTSKSNAIHDRIIWDCAWTWDEKFFITVSRDKKAILWSTDGVQEIKEDGSISHVTSKLFDSSIQAVDSPNQSSLLCNTSPLSYLFALGFEDGNVNLVCVTLMIDGESSWQVLKSLTKLHNQPIRRLAFKPMDDEKLILASAADDCIVKLTEVLVETN